MLNVEKIVHVYFPQMCPTYKQLIWAFLEEDPSEYDAFISIGLIFLCKVTDWSGSGTVVMLFRSLDQTPK